MFNPASLAFTPPSELSKVIIEQALEAGRISAQARAERQRQKLAETQALINQRHMQAEEDMRREQLQREAEASQQAQARANDDQIMQVAKFVQGQQAATPMSAAPSVPASTQITPSSVTPQEPPSIGAPPPPPPLEEAPPPPPEVGGPPLSQIMMPEQRKPITIRLSSGREIPLAPIPYKEQVQQEALNQKMAENMISPTVLAAQIRGERGGDQLGSFEDFLRQLYPGGRPGPQEILRAREQYTKAGRQEPILGGMNQLYGQIDPEAIASSIIGGNLPPDVSQYGRVASGAVASKLAKQDYNLAKAQTDWKATQRYFASVNSTQQLRLRQAAQTAYDSLDVIEQLAGKWKGGKFPILNRANLVLAQNGLYGKKAAEVARQLEAQITDVTAELGQVYMGGGTPTDKALDLARKNLSADWQEGVLKKNIDLARTNLRIRLNSIDTVGVVGPSETNPYAGPKHETSGTTPPVKGGMKDPKRLIKYQGKLVPFDSLSPELQERVTAAGG